MISIIKKGAYTISRFDYFYLSMKSKMSKMKPNWFVLLFQYRGYNEYNVLSKSVHEDTDHVETVNIAVPMCDYNNHNNHNIF